MLIPDYDRSVINLASSLAGDSAPAANDYPPLQELSERGLDERPVVFLLIDGLGYQFLQRHPGSVLAQHVATRLSSVFPTTTATAVSGLALGVAARQHAITGWFTYIRELGCVAAPLPMLPRGGGLAFDELGISAAQLLDARPMLPHLNRPVTVVSPHYIVDSSYSRALFGSVERQGHHDLEEFFAFTEQALRKPGAPLVWSYWSQLDTLAHQYGIESGAVEDHFHALDRAFAAFLERISGLGALVVLSADHGLIDTDADHLVRLEEHPELQVMLQLPLCGEPRAAFCYLRDGARQEFEAYVAEALDGRVICRDSRVMAAEGLFGRGIPGLRFEARIGDYLLLPQANWVIKDHLLQEKAFDQVGVHGGLSSEELYVPLVIVEP